MAEKNVQSRLLQFMESNPGKRLHLISIADDLKLTTGQVQSGVYQLSRRPGVEEHIEVILKGKCWVWHPEPRKTGHVPVQTEVDPETTNEFFADIELSKIGLGQQGIVAQDADGALWLVRKL